MTTQTYRLKSIYKHVGNPRYAMREEARHLKRHSILRICMAIALVLSGLFLMCQGLSLPVSAGASAQVAVRFTILPTQTLTVSTDALDFGVASPQTPSAPRQVIVTVRSNVSYDLSYRATDLKSESGWIIPVSRLSPDGGRTSLGHFGRIATAVDPTPGAPYQQIFTLIVLLDDPTGDYTGAITYYLEPR